jgi:hypothetical protein
MDVENLYHKLHLSVKHLATGKGLLRDRLQEIYVSHLISLRIDGTSALEAQLREARDLATASTPEWKQVGKLHCTLATNHWRTNRKIAEIIFRAYELALPEYCRSVRVKPARFPGLSTDRRLVATASTALMLSGSGVRAIRPPSVMK